MALKVRYRSVEPNHQPTGSAMIARSVNRLLPLLVATLCAGSMLTSPALAAPDAADKQFMAASGLFERGLYELAAEEYRGFIAGHPRHERIATARYALGLCHYQLGDHDKAIDPLKTALKDKQLPDRDQALAVLGHCQLLAGRTEQAIRTFDQLISRHPQSPHAQAAMVNRIQARLSLGQYDQAAQAADQFVDQHGDSRHRPIAEYLKAMALFRGGRLDQAIATIEPLVRSADAGPHAIDALLLAGQIYEQAGRLDQAIERYQQFIDRADQSRKSEGYFSLGAALYQKGNHKPAIETLNHLLDEYPDQPYAPAARIQLAMALLATEQVGKARRQLEQVVKDQPSRQAQARYWLARCDMAEGRYEQALATLNALADRKPAPANLADVLFARADCLLEMNQFQEAADSFAAFARRFKDDPRGDVALYRQAYGLYQAGDYQASLRVCESIDRSAGRSIQAEIDPLRAENLFMLGRYDQAERIYDRLLRSDALDTRDRWLLRFGQCAYFAGEYDRAIERLQKLAGDRQAMADPLLHEALFLIGDAHLQRGNHRRAAEALRRYLPGSEEHREEARLKLALACLGTDAVDQAAEQLASLTKGDRQSPWVQRGLFEYAQLLYNQKDQPDAAKKLLVDLVEQEAEADLIASSRYLLGWIALDKQNYDTAADRFDQVIKQHPDSDLVAEAMYQRAVALKRKGDFDEALKQLDHYLSKYAGHQRHEQGLFLKGVCLSRAGKHKQAIGVLSNLARDKQAVTDALLYELAWALRQADDAKAAIATYRRLIERFDQSDLLSPARAELAELLYLEGDYRQALQLLQKVESDPQADPATRGVAQYRMAWCLAHLDQPDKAAEAFAEYAKQGHDSSLRPAALYQSGVQRAKLQRYDQARDTFKQFIEQHPEHDLAAVAHLKLGEVLAAMNRYAESQRIYQQYLQRFPEDPMRYLGYFGVGWALENDDRFTDARQWYAKVIESHNGPTAARAQFQTGETYFNEGKFELAARELLKTEIVYAYPQWSAKALFEAGRAFEQLGQVERAMHQFERVIKQYPDEVVAELAAQSLKRLN
jgi:TolA-binding protein